MSESTSRFIPNAAVMQRILYDLVKGKKKRDKTTIDWSEAAVQAFQTCKNSIAQAALLAHPNSEANMLGHNLIQFSLRHTSMHFYNSIPSGDVITFASLSTINNVYLSFSKLFDVIEGTFSPFC
ncbi:hypothetical protein AVEN_144752-1 [Araneus ventricosus]|uniref:Reverse transcriptase/retrotransposon-derived protein RNase H-like domain-containing protein n=1 Tax=Araneus ventricosus TaxID=182803 RepID=A0A4Y2M1D9_ARAVE|nr:hypothetical protein AVEN_144752-1 [Araneus ventricosus]